MFGVFGSLTERMVTTPRVPSEDEVAEFHVSGLPARRHGFTYVGDAWYIRPASFSGYATRSNLEQTAVELLASAAVSSVLDTTYATSSLTRCNTCTPGDVRIRFMQAVGATFGDVPVDSAHDTISVAAPFALIDDGLGNAYYSECAGPNGGENYVPRPTPGPGGRGIHCGLISFGNHTRAKLEQPPVSAAGSFQSDSEYLISLLLFFIFATLMFTTKAARQQ
jgi:hypothetical protein